MAILFLAFTLHATCLTPADVKTNVCWAICRTDGFDTGSYEEKTDSCICGQRRKYRDATDKVIRVVPKKKDDDETHYE